MAQDIFDDINPASTSGSQLAALLNDFKDAVVSGFSGPTSRPPNLQPYGYWVKYNDPDDGILSYLLYDGTKDIELFKINKTTANILLGSVEDDFDIVKNSDDSFGPLLKLRKNRVSGSGQTLDGDTLGEVNFLGQDASQVEHIQARILAVSEDDTTGSTLGSQLGFYIAREGTSSVIKSMTLSKEGKLGIGTETPSKQLETSASSAIDAGVKHKLVADVADGVDVVAHKSRIAASGQVLDADTIANFKGNSTEQNGNEVPSFNIKGVAIQDHTNTAAGTKVEIQRVKTDEVALTTAVTIDDDGVSVVGDLDVSGSINAPLVPVGALVVSDTTESTDKDTGSIITEGGVGIEKNLNVGGSVEITGDLTVNGTTTTIDTDTLEVKDANITVNKDGTEATADTQDAGLTIEMSDATDCKIGFDSTLTSKFKIGEVGSESEVITSAGAQNLTGKAVITPSRLDVKQDTKANLDTYATTASNGQFCFATDEKKMYQVVDSALTSVGSGIGGADTLVAIRSDDADVADLETGNNADFDGGGTLVGSLTQSTTTADLLIGESAFKYAATTASQNDYWRYTYTLPLLATHNYLRFGFGYKNDSTTVDEDFAFCVKIVGGSLDGDITYYDLNTVYNTDRSGKTFQMLQYIPSDATSVKYGWQNKGTTTTTEFMFDNIELSLNTFVKDKLTLSQSLIYDGYGGFGSTNTAIVYFDTEERNVGADLLTISNSTVDGFSITAKQDTYVIFSLTGNQSAARNWGISKDSNQLTTSITNITASHRMGVMYSGQSSTNDSSGNTVFAGVLLAGETLRPHTEGSGANSSDFRVKLTVLATAENPAVLTPAKAGSHTIRYDGYTSRDGSGFIKFKTKQYEHTVGGVSLLSEDNTGTFTKYTALDASYFDFSLGARLTSTGDFELRRYNSSGVEQEAYRREFIVNASVSAKIKMNKGDYVLGYSAVDAVDVVDATIFQVTATPLYATLMAAIPKDIQYDLTVTGTNWTTIRAVGIPYEAANNVWRMKFNINGTLSPSTNLRNLTLSGVIFKAGVEQACAVSGPVDGWYKSYASGNTSLITFQSSASATTAVISGDVELDSKPTFI